MGEPRGVHGGRPSKTVRAARARARPAVRRARAGPFLTDAARSSRRRTRAAIYPRALSSIASKLDSLCRCAARKTPSSTRLFGGVRSSLGAPLLRARFPRAYTRRQPRALRTRSANVRRPACRRSRTPARSVWPAASARSRASSARLRRFMPDDCRSRRPSGGSTGFTSPIIALLRELHRQSALRRISAWRSC